MIANRSSFRTRIAFLSAVLAGGALIGFSLISWILIYEAKLKRLDAAIENQLIQTNRPRSPQWQSYAEALPAALGTDEKTSVALLLKDLDGNLIYQSSYWKDGLDANSLWRSLPQPPRVPRDIQPPSTPSPPAITQESPQNSKDLSTQLAESPLPIVIIQEGSPSLKDIPDQLNQSPPPMVMIRERPQNLRDRSNHPSQFPPPRPPHQPESLLPWLEKPLERSSENPPPQDEPPNPPLVLKAKMANQYTGKEVWRVGVISSPRMQAAIAVNLQSIDLEMASIRSTFLIAIPLILLLVAVGAWAISGSILRPIQKLTAAIRSVNVQELNQRVPLGTTDIEFVELIQVFNQMLQRLERSFKQASRFSGDAAHELKTPLAILQGELERSLLQAELGSPLQQTLSNLLDEVRRLSEIARKLLLLSLADAGRMSLYQVEIDLSALLAEIAEDIELLAPNLQIQIEIAAKLSIHGDRDLIVRVLHNLVDNAIKYNLPKGWISLQASYMGARVIVKVTNSSMDIPKSEGDRIFERFHRGKAEQTQKVEGSGLGLSLAREIALAHGGDLKLDPAIRGQTSFTLILPSRTVK